MRQGSEGVVQTVPESGPTKLAQPKRAQREEPAGGVRESFAKTRTPPKQEKDGVLGNPHRHLPGKPQRGPGELSRLIALHSPYSSGNKVTIKHRTYFSE
jgi:hypothetical protein